MTPEQFEDLLDDFTGLVMYSSAHELTHYRIGLPKYGRMLDQLRATRTALQRLEKAEKLAKALTLIDNLLSDSDDQGMVQPVRQYIKETLAEWEA